MTDYCYLYRKRSGESIKVVFLLVALVLLLGFVGHVEQEPVADPPVRVVQQ